MEVLSILLRKEGYIEDVLTVLTATDIHDAIVLNATNMRQIIAQDIPIFAGFKRELGAGTNYFRLIVATIPLDDILTDMLKLLKKSGLDFSDSQLGSIHLIPCRKVI
jgi:hypothetical protein